MASDDDLVSLGPWPKGVDNRSADHRIPAGAARAARDVTIRADGSISRRDGYVLLDSTAMHSLWPQCELPGIDFMLGVRGTTLVKISVSASGDLSFTSLRTGMSLTHRVSYVAVNGVVYYSNGVVSGRIVNGAHRAWGVELPSSSPVLTAAVTGGLHEGKYLATCTFVDDLGEESGALAGVSVDVAEGGGIAVTGIPQPADANVDYVRVYVTEANGSVFYRYAELAVGTTSVNVTASTTPGPALMTQFMVPPPPAYLLEAHGGRIYGADPDYPQFPWFTETFRHGLMKQTNRLAFEDDVDMMLSTDGGMFLAADRTFFLQGSDPKAFAPREVFPYKAVRYATLRDPDKPNVMWLSQEGFCMGGPDGSAVNLTQERVAFTDGINSGAMIYHETGGTKQAIAAMTPGIASSAASTSQLNATVIRRAAIQESAHIGDSMEATVV